MNSWFATTLLSLPVQCRIIDLGAGHGREAIYAASQGHRVQAVDHLPELTERGQALAERYLDDGSGGRLEFSCADLRTRAAQLDPNDVVVTIRVGGGVVADAVEAALGAQRFPKLWFGVFLTREHRERFGKSFSDRDSWEDFAARLERNPELNLARKLVRNHRETAVCCRIRKRQS